MDTLGEGGGGIIGRGLLNFSYIRIILKNILFK